MLWSSRSSVFIFCQASPVDYCHKLCCYVGVLYHCYLLHFKCYHAVNRRFVSFLFCLPFANRASVSGDLYIDFDRNHLIFPVACLVCQVTALFIIFLPEHAYASHIISCISYMFCIMLLAHFSLLIVVPFVCVLVLGRAGRWVRERGTCWVRLRGSSFRQLWEPCRQDDHTLEITSILAC